MPHRCPVRAVAFTALVALALAACGDDGADPQATAATAAPAAAVSTTTAASTTAAAAAPTPSAAPASAITTTTAAGTVIEIAYRGGKLEGNGRKQIPKGRTVTLRVTSDVAEEVHVHGYDKEATIAAGSTAEITFVADVAGIFEVELHKKHLKIADLEVR
jgi:heme/copper-type cytochrome/quinol oxidase subunit 2